MRGFLKIFLFVSAVILVTHGKNKKTLSARIIGGEISLRDQHNYQVSLRRLKYFSWSPKPFTENFCGGAILNKRWILSAAHCCTRKQIPKLSEVLIGMGERQFSQNSLMHRAENIIRHPNYDNSNQYLKYDISLIKTNRDIVFNEHIKPIPLAKDWIDEKEPVTVAGWGLYEHLEKSLYIRFTYLKTLSNSDCIQKYGEPASKSIDDSILCAYSNYGVGLCDGDGGNPLVFNGRLVGIALWNVSDDTLPCTTVKPNQFTRVNFYLDWIKNYANVSIV